MRAHLIGVATAHPDAVVRWTPSSTGAAEVEIPVATADLKGKSRADRHVGERAALRLRRSDQAAADRELLFAHSPMEGSWIIESADDLSGGWGFP